MADPTIGLWPYDLAANAYVGRTRQILGRFGTVRELPSVLRLSVLIGRRLFQLRSPKRYDLIIVNWRENVIARGREWPSLSGAIVYLGTLLIFRLACTRLIYVRHNRYPHSLGARYRRSVERLIELGQRLADEVVVHSPVDALEHGYRYVPHPLYEAARLTASQLTNEFLVFGRIERYKQIAELLRVWRGPAGLVIAGPVCDPDYLDELMDLARDKPVRITTGLQDEAVLGQRLARSRGLILAHAPDSLIVSGTFFFALSWGAAVYALGNSFYEWLGEAGFGDIVTTFDSLESLAVHCGGLTGNAPCEPHAIRESAAALFGDDAVASAWSAVLGQADTAKTVFETGS